MPFILAGFPGEKDDGEAHDCGDGIKRKGPAPAKPAAERPAQHQAGDRADRSDRHLPSKPTVTRRTDEEIADQGGTHGQHERLGDADRDAGGEDRPQIVEQQRRHAESRVEKSCGDQQGSAAIFVPGQSGEGAEEDQAQPGNGQQGGDPEGRVGDVVELRDHARDHGGEDEHAHHPHDAGDEQDDALDSACRADGSRRQGQAALRGAIGSLRARPHSTNSDRRINGALRPMVTAVSPRLAWRMIANS